MGLIRRIFVSAGCKARHPDATLVLRRLVEHGRCTEEGAQWRLEGNWDVFLQRALGRTTIAGKKEYVALLTPAEMEAEPYHALPPICRKTFGKFAQDVGLKMVPVQVREPQD
jgi:hypothetical protein